ncbi:MAG: hypothetical protein FWD17_13665, partial [Polyangiaceae bacterium]|nr:hypothetical protein [Polyangiaceae bacterium]
MRSLGFGLFALGVFGTSAACGGRSQLFVETFGEPTPSPAPAATSGSYSSQVESHSSQSRQASTTVAVSPSASQSTRSTSTTSSSTSSDCPIPWILVISQSQFLYQFISTANTFQVIEKLTCPTQVPGARPFSMAVSQSGLVYIEYDSG